MKPGDYVRVLPPFDTAFTDAEYQIVATVHDGYRLNTGSDFSPMYLELVRESDFPNPNVITKLSFRNKFTQSEKVAIYIAAESNIAIKVWLDDIMVAEEIDLNNSETINGVQSLEQLGLIAPNRANEILGVQ